MKSERVAVLFLVALLASPWSGTGAKGKEKPNVILIVIDALRQDHVGTYGYGRDTTPNIDTFAKKALVFDFAVSQCSWTSPSVASLFTGLYPSVHGVILHGKGKASVLPENLRLPKLLR